MSFIYKKKASRYTYSELDNVCMHMCIHRLFACLAQEPVEPRVQTSPHFICMLPMRLWP